jgi:hypothetical protein
LSHSTLCPAACAGAHRSCIASLASLLLTAQTLSLPSFLVCNQPGNECAAGTLAHSYSAALYFLPPQGPTATDLVLMAGLSQLVPLVPVVGSCCTAPAGVANLEAVAQLLLGVEGLLTAPEKMVPGLKAQDIRLPVMWLG